MKSTNPPRKDDILYFMDEEITVLKIYESFQLARVRYNYSKIEFVVDIHALSVKPDKTSSISIKILGGVR